MDFIKKKKLKYKNNKTFYQKSAELRLLHVWSNLKKKTFFFLWTKNDKLWVLLYKHVKRGQKRLKKAKKMDFAKTKTEIHKQQNLLSKIRWVTFFTSVIQFEKKTNFFCFGSKLREYEFFDRSAWKGGKKRLKKAKKMDFAKTKTDIYKQQTLLSKICWVTFFTSVIQFKKKEKFDFGQKWQILSAFAKKSQL